MPRAGARCLLAVHAHPDDETITTGGTLARYAAEGVRTIVVTCTNGNLGEGSDPQGQRRLRELEAAAQVLGVSRLLNLGYFDSGMPGWPDNHRAGAFFAAQMNDAVQRLVTILTEERPQVVLTYDETGGYGHPDHVKTHQVTVAACAAAGVPRLYFARIPLTWSRHFVAALRGTGIDAPGSAPTGADAGPEVAEVGVPDDRVTARIDVSRYVDQKRRALACHASQMPPDHFLMRMSPALAADLWQYEFYSRPGATTEVDLFEGLPS